MQQDQRLFEVKTHMGKPWTIGDFTITPESQALTLRWPGGGFVWNRPVAVLVERAQETERIPIFDVTLLAGVALMAAGLLSLVISTTLWIGRRRRSHE
jgi:hypothetical protein